MHRDKNSTCRRRAGTLALLLVVAVTSALVLSGCATIGSAGAPGYSDLSLGRMRATQTAKSAAADQQISEYGVFYSTDLEAIKAVDANPSTGDQGDVQYFPVIETQPDVKVVRRQLAQTVLASTVGTLSVDIKGLEPGTAYYTRFYAIGRFTSDGSLAGTLFGIGGHVTSDPTLKSLKKSKGTLSPKFSRTTYVYKDTISRSTKGSRITVVPSNSGSAVQMKVGTGAWSTVRSKYVAVSRGKSKVLYIKVTAPDGVAADYVVTIKRKK